MLGLVMLLIVEGSIGMDDPSQTISNGNINTQYADLLFDEGVTLYELGRYKEALERFNSVLKTNPIDTDAWNNKGNALYYLGRYDEALIAYEKAIELSPDYSDAWSNKGNTLNYLRRYEEALIALDKSCANCSQRTEELNQRVE